MILVSIIVCLITGFIGRYVAKEKNRSATEGFLFGFLLNLVGVIIVALLPTKEPKPEDNIEWETPKYASTGGEFSGLKIIGILLLIIFFFIILDVIT